MEKTRTTWRRNSDEDIAGGAPEMVQVKTEVFDDGISAIEEEKSKYDQRMIDGVNAYLSLMSELRLTGIANSYPRSVLKGIETAYELVKSQLVDGQWVSARENCDDVVIQLPVTQELHDRIKSTLEDYIATSYGKTYAEIVG